ncbi:MAG: hypothetical protein V4850_04815 [Myxococcota bacterium]
MSILALTFLVGCGPQDTGLTNGNNDNDIVNGTGRMTLSVTELVIEHIVLGFSQSAQFTVESVGDANLQIYEMRIVADTDDVFFFNELENLEMAPGQSESYSVVADLTVDAPSYGELRLRTSDPDAAALILPLHAYPEGYVPPEDTDTEDTDTEDTDTAADSGGGA